LSGSEFQTDGAVTEKVHRAMSVLVLGTNNSGARGAECRCLVGSARLVRLLRYAGVDVARTLCMRTAVFHVMRCRTGSQWSDCRRGSSYLAWSKGWRPRVTV